MAEGSLEKGFILDPEAKMKSRIDEQSELICILKKRADQLLRESKSAENRVRLMERTNADLVKQIRAEKERVKMLEDRFNELAGNHQDMIKFKDMHKKTAVDLRDENDLLREQNASLMGPLIKAKNEEIENWKNENENLFAKIAKLERNNTELSEEVVILKESDTQKSIKIDSLLTEIDEIKVGQMSSDFEKSSKITKLEEKLKINQTHFDNERSRLRSDAEQNSILVVSKDDELSKVKLEMTALNKKLLSIETEWNQAKSKLARDAAYKQLLEENNALQARLDEKERTFEAFTKHSRELIEKEKFLNKRLRAYSLQIEK